MLSDVPPVTVVFLAGHVVGQVTLYFGHQHELFRDGETIDLSVAFEEEGLEEQLADCELVESDLGEHGGGVGVLPDVVGLLSDQVIVHNVAFHEDNQETLVDHDLDRGDLEHLDQLEVFAQSLQNGYLVILLDHQEVVHIVIVER